VSPNQSRLIVLFWSPEEKIYVTHVISIRADFVWVWKITARSRHGIEDIFSTNHIAREHFSSNQNARTRHRHGHDMARPYRNFSTVIRNLLYSHRDVKMVNLGTFFSFSDAPAKWSVHVLIHGFLDFSGEYVPTIPFQLITPYFIPFHNPIWSFLPFNSLSHFILSHCIPIFLSKELTDFRHAENLTLK
jgi:hypothetical protein